MSHLNIGKSYPTDHLKQLALAHGFSFCGVSEAGFLEDEARRLERWLGQHMQGKMSYMERNIDKRLDPTLLVPGARSVVSLMFNYYPGEAEPSTSFKVSKYAWGEDYHSVVRDRLHLLLADLRKEYGHIQGRVFVDSAPVLEKAWAAKSGLGWVGKNTNLIRKGEGSFFFLAEMILDIPFEPDGPVTDHCGTCTACIEACPTDAIVEPYVVDGSKCISYFTIELKDAIPAEQKGKFEDWIFGCDICQDVCPWNRFSAPHRVDQFQPRGEWQRLSREGWREITHELFDDWFRDSPLQRAGYHGLMRNVRFAGEEK